MEDRVNPFSQRSGFANFVDFVTMHRRRVGGYGDIHLQVPEVEARGHGHAHGAGSRKPTQFSASQSLNELFTVMHMYKEMRHYRSKFREMTTEKEKRSVSVPYRFV